MKAWIVLRKRSSIKAGVKFAYLIDEHTWASNFRLANGSYDGRLISLQRFERLA